MVLMTLLNFLLNQLLVSRTSRGNYESPKPQPSQPYEPPQPTHPPQQKPPQTSDESNDACCSCGEWKNCCGQECSCFADCCGTSGGNDCCPCLSSICTCPCQCFQNCFDNTCTCIRQCCCCQPSLRSDITELFGSSDSSNPGCAQMCSAIAYGATIVKTCATACS